MGIGVGFTRVDLGRGVVAGFTNRFGGVSEAPYESLNLGPNVNDSPQAVAANRRIISELVGGPIVFSSQVHGANVIQVDDAGVRAWISPNPPVSVGEADALITTSAEVGIGVLVADCVPILLASHAPSGIAATAHAPSGIAATAHAGRRGIELNVIGAAVEKMRAQGATKIRAAVGPAVCGKCYEVPAAMRAEVAAKEPKAWAETATGTPGLDLPTAATHQLKHVGVEVVYRSPICTFEHHDYFSHRRATAKLTEGGPGVTGRQAGIIRLLA